MPKKEELAILQKAYDMIEYGYVALRQYPKSEKHTLAAETKRSMYDLMRLIIRANKRFHKKTTFQDIDIELENLRYLIRLGNGLGFLPFKKYENWSRKLNEVGRMLGGWMKSMK
ncbi:diversity-generating retroelement protein Avd [Halobacillus trueperi]|uniref:Diversity-generating retroelement protein Avd n=1 Tax=Halobacillus trueperi TaxID=156205 RepID=A0A3D8VLW5_9BACI|nr:diversity-generating retroelement protein Avd [Halobacillus trueperi]RDY70335.1 diversity-generating retroelement protein Avd [Halobacillus trueperi]